MREAKARKGLQRLIWVEYVVFRVKVQPLQTYLRTHTEGHMLRLHAIIRRRLW